MRAKRGQISLFVIIGLILLIISVIAISANNQLLNARLDAQAQEAVGEFLELNALDNYVSGCLDKVASNGLLLLGEQGGVIYDSQGGLTAIKESKEGLTYLPHTFFRMEKGEGGTLIPEQVNRNISYSILPRVDCLQFQGPYISVIDIEQTSYYPVKETHFNDYINVFRRHYTNGGCYGYFDTPYVSQSGFLGANHFPKLCSYNGSNKFDPYARIAPCKPEQYDSKYSSPSMQKQLESYIKNNLGTCVNISNYEKYSALKINIDDENVIINTTILQPRGISISANYPLTVQVNERSVSQIISFDSELNTNVRQLYDYVSRLLINSVRDPNFDLQKDWNDSNKNPDYKTTFDLFYYQAPCLDCKKDSTKLDYVLVITDQSSLLKGRPWSIMTGIKQRKPVLDYLNNQASETFILNEKVDYQFFSNSTVFLDPLAIDPDGGNVSYNYSGWKEDYDQILDWDLCEQNACDLSNYKNYLSEKIFDPPPLKWSSSSEFQSTKRSASFNTSKQDIGLHNITIIVTDDKGNKDFQIVKILIFDLPEAKLNISNYYDDIDNSWASVEDPVFLDGSESIASLLAGGTISQYIFQDDYSNSQDSFLISTQNSFVNLSDNFFNASQEYFKYKNLINNIQANSGFLDHDVSLFVRQDNFGSVVQSPPATETIHVAQCLPHSYDKNNGGYDGAQVRTDGLYYYAVSENYFDAPHVCCEPLTQTQGTNSFNSQTNNLLGGGTISDKGVVCFEQEFKTCLPDRNLENPYVYLKGSLFDKETAGEVYTVEYNASLMTISNAYPPSIQNINLKDNRINDVYELSLEQSCSGLRGNTCGGEMNFEWTITYCNDLDDNIGQFAKCQGPATNDVPVNYFLNCMNKDLGDDLDCYDFSAGENFEKDSLGLNNELQANLWTDEEMYLMSQGYCAPTRYASIDLQGSIDYESGTDLNEYALSSAPYFCEANCDGQGDCNYWQLEDCSCGLENSCNGLSADKFDLDIGSNNPENKYYCTNSRSACSTDCSEKNVYDNSNDRAACYCNFNPGASVSESDISSFERFFDSGNSYGGSVSGNCCAGDNVIVNTNSNKVCYEGMIRDDGTIINPNLLSCSGEIYFCDISGSSNSKPLFAIPSSVNVNYCGKTCDSQSGW